MHHVDKIIILRKSTSLQEKKVQMKRPVLLPDSGIHTFFLNVVPQSSRSVDLVNL